MAKKIFKERQRFNSMEVIILIGFLMFGICYRLITGLMNSSSNFSTQLVCIAVLVLFGLLIKFLLKMELRVWVSEKSLNFKMFPWHSKKQKILWKNVQSCEIITTPIIAQWHGGNISFNHEKRYTLSGRNGVLLMTKDGNEYFIGSRKLDKLKRAVEKALRDKEQ